MSPDCPLCYTKGSALFHRTKHAPLRRNFFRCPKCSLIFADPETHLPPDEEHTRYRMHENDAADLGYRAFASRLFEPMQEQLKAGAEGLDYGAGADSALAALFKEAGMIMRVYDPYFHPDRTPLKETYDFVCVSETAEHFYHPEKEFTTLRALLRSGGLLGVMTSLVYDENAFASWHYHTEETHVCFYSEMTMRYIAETYAFHVSFPRKNVTLFVKE